MEISIESDRDQCVKVRLIGRVSQYDWEKGFEPLEQALSRDVYTRRLSVDMSRVDHIDSSGVAWLLRVDKQFKQDGGLLVLHSCQPNVIKVLTVLRMQAILKIAEDAKKADALVSGGPA